jgi:UDP-N-acetylglucosamine--N-acetylmuramyl-(pentapeptide) pyrophosphoryl-undecaprenol N-acetylglucosamine transferase
MDSKESLSVKKILIAAGGTGGHLFPAQALAHELLKKGDVALLFVGGDLSSNRCFQRDRFSFREISTSTPYLIKRDGFFRSLWRIVRGIGESFRIITSFRPDVVVGFGSYHAFPLLIAAFFRRVPMVLFEPNSIPGKVNRLFSRVARASAVQFFSAASLLHGKAVEVDMPIWQRDEEAVSVQEARAYFGLHPDKFTFLVFGGSQGAVSINHLFSEALPLILSKYRDFQVIHFTGNEKSAERFRETYARLSVPACVKGFEERMYCAWRAPHLVICRSGAATVAEHIFFEMPALLIPYPHAADDHQRHNALFMEKQVGGALLFKEDSTDPEKLSAVIQELLDPSKNRLEQMRAQICHFKTLKRRESLSNLVYHYD